MKNQEDIQGIGKKLHRLLNNTVARKLTIPEYKNVIELIALYGEKREREMFVKILTILQNGLNPRQSKKLQELKEALSPSSTEQLPTKTSL